MKPDAFIRMRFRTTVEGGRENNIIILDIPYGCPLLVDNEAFDCRILIKNKTLFLGETYELPIKLLSPELAFPRLFPGKTVKLWEGKDIASGEVLRVYVEAK